MKKIRGVFASLRAKARGAVGRGGKDGGWEEKPESSSSGFPRQIVSLGIALGVAVVVFVEVTLMVLAQLYMDRRLDAAERRAEIAELTRRVESAELKVEVAEQARKTDIAELRADVAELTRRADIAELRAEIAEQTRRQV